MIILSINKKGKYYLLQTSSQVYSILPIIVMKYRLKANQDISLETLKEVINDNTFEEALEKSYKKLAKPLTVHQYKTFLNDQAIPLFLHQTLIERMKKQNLLNDQLWIDTYISMNQNKGPYYLREKLRDKGAPFELIEAALQTLNQEEMLDLMMEKTIKKLKIKSNKQMRQALVTHLVSKGFSYQIVESKVNQYQYLLPNLDENTIVKDMIKVLKKHQKKYDQSEVIKRTTDDLLKKGYQYTLIDTCIKQYISSSKGENDA